MKTIIIKFPSSRVTEVAIKLYSLELTVLMSWSIEGFMDDIVIFAVLKLSNSGESIPSTLQLEKLREMSFIKIIKE
jgi:hypothetical protein